MSTPPVIRRNGFTIIDLLHAIAIFGWANRLMHNLGEPADGVGG
jgi:hypothetical protein